MKTALAELNELIQKQIVDAPEYVFETSGSDHQLMFTCTIKLMDETFTATAAVKNKAKQKATELLLTHLKATIDLTKKHASEAPAPKHQATPVDDETKNPISVLLELAQQGCINPASYEFLRHHNVKPSIAECICRVDTLSTQALNTNKQKAKAAASLSMLRLLESENLIKAPTKTVVSSDAHITQATPNPISVLMEAAQINQLHTLNYDYKTLPNGQYQCICQADHLELEASASSKKTAKLIVSKNMVALLNEAGYHIGEKPFKQNHLVEANACGEWIRSICPDDVDLRRISWYLNNDCVVLHLGLKQPNTKTSVDAFKKAIEDKTHLLVLVNRYRDAKKAIESLQMIAEDGCIYDPRKIHQIALGHYFKPRQYPEPVITFDKRHDHTKAHCFTIDSKTSVDLDDAFSINTEEPNATIVYVHIADVATLLRAGTQEDIKASKQCFSYYGASKQLPMLGNETTYQASLLPHKDRMAWTIKMVLTPEAEVRDYRIYPSVIRSKFRLDQKSIGLLVGKEGHQYSRDFKTMAELSDKLIAKRLSEGGVNSFNEEALGYLLVQEFMLLANRCVAEFCLQNNIPIPFRVHQFPDNSMDIKNIYNTYKNHRALLPFLGRASYSMTPQAHEALAFEHYCHFTSPIRRYADVLVQRQLKRFYCDAPLYRESELTTAIETINQQEQQLEMSQTTIRYIERLQVQFKQAGKRLESVVDAIQADGYRLKALSMKCDYAMHLPKHLCNEPLAVGDTVFVILLGKYHVMEECFACEPA